MAVAYGQGLARATGELSERLADARGFK